MCETVFGWLSRIQILYFVFIQQFSLFSGSTKSNLLIMHTEAYAHLTVNTAYKRFFYWLIHLVVWNGCVLCTLYLDFFFILTLHQALNIETLLNCKKRRRPKNIKVPLYTYQVNWVNFNCFVFQLGKRTLIKDADLNDKYSNGYRLGISFKSSRKVGNKMRKLSNIWW